jgi:hypothetical protein
VKQIKSLGRLPSQKAAAVSMAFDHTAIAFFQSNFWMRAVGRAAFPLYCAALVEGFENTRNPKRYLARLMILGVASEYIFDLFFFGRIFWGRQNVVFTLALALAVMMMQCRLDARLEFLPWSAAMILSWLIRSDYGPAGILLIFLIHRRRFRARGFVLSVGCFAAVTVLEAVLSGAGFGAAALGLFSLLSVLFVGGSDEKHKPRPGVRLMFYLWYPAHMLVLLAIQAWLAAQ